MTLHEERTVRLLWRNLRKSAKRRGIKFALSWQWFKLWAVNTGYAFLHGKGPDDYQVDRRRNHLGYTPRNVQILTASQHGRKSRLERMA